MEVAQIHQLCESAMSVKNLQP